MLIGYFALRLVYINFPKREHIFSLLLGFWSSLLLLLLSMCLFIFLLFILFSSLDFWMEKKIVLHLNVSFKLDYLYECVCVCVCVFCFVIYCDWLRLYCVIRWYSFISWAVQWMCGFLWPKNEIKTKATPGGEKKAFQTHIHINWANKLFRNDQIRARMSQMEGKPNSTKWFVFTHLHVPHTNRNCCLKCF